MRVKSRKPPAENLITSLSVTPSEIGGGADDVVGDQVRQVAGDGEHQVVVRGVHDLDLASPAPQNVASFVDRCRIGAGWRRQDAPAAVEQLGEAGIRARLLGAGDRVAGDEMHALRARAAPRRARPRP